YHNMALIHKGDVFVRLNEDKRNTAYGTVQLLSSFDRFPIFGYVFVAENVDSHTQVCLPLASEQEVGDRGDEVDERGCGPPPLSAPDLFLRTPVDVHESYCQQPNLDHTR